MEPNVSEWCLLEYKHISETVGKKNLIFTNVKNDKDKLIDFGEVREQSVEEIILDFGGKICLLDMDAEQELVSSEKEKFEFFLFGGILGDNPRKHRTAELKNKVKCETRNLTDKQMSTNTAVYVTKKVLDGMKLNEFRFCDELEIVLDEDNDSGESVILEFRYVIENDNVVLPKGFIEYLKNKKEI